MIWLLVARVSCIWAAGIMPRYQRSSRWAEAYKVTVIEISTVCSSNTPHMFKVQLTESISWLALALI